MGGSTRSPRLAVLSNRHFRAFLVGSSVSALGGALSPVAVTFAVLAINGSAADLGLVLGLGMVPLLVLTLAGGVAGDRRERRRILIAADCTMAVCQTVLAITILTGTAEIWIFVLVGLVTGSSHAFSRPAVTGFVPTLVAEDELQSANSLLRAALSAAQIVGPALAGVILAVSSPGWALAADAATFLVSAAVLRRLPRSSGTGSTRPVREDLAEGWSELRARRWAVAMIGSFAIYQATVLPAVFVVGPLVAEDNFSGATTWAAIMSARAVGALIAAAVTLSWLPRRPLVASAALGCLEIPFLVLLATGGSIPVLLALAVISTVGLIAAETLWETTLQNEVPRDLLSRMSSYDWLGSVIFNPAGMILVGLIATDVGATPVLLAAAGVNTLVRGALMASPAVRMIRRRP
jgi:MFS family permease